MTRSYVLNVGSAAQGGGGNFQYSPSLADGSSFTVSNLSVASRTFAKAQFEICANGSNGVQVSTGNTNFDTVNGVTYFSNTYSRGGPVSIKIEDDYGAGHQLRTLDFAPTDHIMVSWAVYVPLNTRYLGTQYSTPAELAALGDTSANFKEIWILTDAAGSATDTDDVTVVINNNGASGWRIEGNDIMGGGNEIELGNQGSDLLTFSSWNRRLVTIRQLGTPGVDDLSFKFSNINSSGHYQGSWTRTASQMYAITGYNPGYDLPWKSMNFLGYNRGQNDTSLAYFADMAIYIGTHAGCRVEIGDNATYANCGDLALQELESWSGNVAAGTIRKGGFGSFSGGPYYYFVHDYDNSLVDSGVIS